MIESLSEQLLRVRDLRIWLNTVDGPVEVVKGISLDVLAGECVALVGESGSGKSITARSLLGLLPRENSSVEGEITLRGGPENVVTATEAQLRKMRGRAVSMVSQDPMTSLDPVARIQRQLRDTIRLREPRLSGEQVRQRALDMLREVGISDPERVLVAWPQQLSGGLRQRVTIALALVAQPALLIADEPTTALDVTVQAQVLRMLTRLRSELGMGLLIITHDMSVVRSVADRVAVMSHGEIVEFGEARQVLDSPQHPYTRGLVASTVTMSTVRDRPLRTVASFVEDTAAAEDGAIR